MPRLGSSPGTMDRRLTHGAGHGTMGDQNLLQHCVADQITSVDVLGKVGVEADMTLGADGLPLVAYYDFTNRRLKTVHCNNIECTDFTASTVGYTTGDVGYRPSIAVNPVTGPSSRPQIVSLLFFGVFGRTSGSLMVLHFSRCRSQGTP